MSAVTKRRECSPADTLFKYVTGDSRLAGACFMIKQSLRCTQDCQITHSHDS